VITQRLDRNRTDRMLGGVCGGIGSYLGVDPTIVRLVFVVATILTGGLVALLYLILWIVIPEEPRWGMGNSFETSFSGTGDPTPGDSSPTGGPGQETGLPPYGSVGSATGFSSPQASSWHAERRRRRHQWSGWVLVSLGTFFLAMNLHLLDWLNFHLFWPLFLIIIGMFLLWRRHVE